MSLHYTHWPIAAAVLLAGCSPLDAIEGKPTSQAAHEQRQALVYEPVLVAVVTADEPVVLTAPAVALLPAPFAPPACVPVFRVQTCPEN